MRITSRPMKYRVAEFGVVAGVAGVGTGAILWKFRQWHLGDEVTGATVIMFIVSVTAFAPLLMHHWFPRARPDVVDVNDDGGKAKAAGKVPPLSASEPQNHSETVS